MELQSVKNSIMQTLMKNWAGCGFASDIIASKIRCTLLKNLGVDNPSKSEEIQKRKEITCFEHFGVSSPAQSDIVMEKIRQTNRERYGVEYTLQSQEVRQRGIETMLRVFGCANPRQSPEICERIRQTVFGKCGYDYYFQSPEFQGKLHKRYTNPKYPNITFATSWEFKVYDFLTENHIEFEYQPKLSIPYEYNGETHYYHPDFRVRDKIVEVKGDNFFRVNEETGKEEMYLTWKGKLSDEEYARKCGLMEAKHQCMLKNRIIILRQHDVNNLHISIFC